MPITPANIAVHELIGLKVSVKKSLSLPYRGLRGTVVDETKNTLVLRTPKGEKAVPKKGCVFECSLPGGERAELDGSSIAYRPFDRPKKVK